jgi:hypothetical protein
MEKDLIFVSVLVLIAVLFNLSKENFLFRRLRKIGKKFQRYYLLKKLNKK